MQLKTLDLLASICFDWILLQPQISEKKMTKLLLNPVQSRSLVFEIDFQLYILQQQLSG